ncbi:MAG: acetyl-CoA C-acyltransferase [Bacteroidia bacterium]|nr:acetyl-CoA C-acyltransferase [Bacteroidia bacterium]
MQTVYIIDAVRTAVGRYGGSLAHSRPDDLAAEAIKGLMSRNSQVDFNQTEEVILGAANQAGEDNRNVARMASLLAGLPVSVSGFTVNRLCASGLQAIINAAQAIMLGHGDLFIAGGVESMTRAPFVMAKSPAAFGRTPEMHDTTIGWRFTNPALSELYYPYTMGETAENVAEKYSISRERQDRFASESQSKWKAAQEAGKFKDEIVPVTVSLKKGETTVFDTDEQPRLSSVEVLGQLKPAFKKGGTVTAGNSSGINDGASVLLMASGNFVEKYGLKPIAKVVSYAAAGVHPEIMGIGPVPATRKALERAGLQVSDINLAELNEAFASQSLACIDELGIDPSIINVNGGSIAIGHPLGGSGARISTTLLHEMVKRPEVKYGLATMCIGVGQGLAVIYERV